MREVYAEYFARWIEGGGETLVHYNDIGIWSKYGFLGVARAPGAGAATMRRSTGRCSTSSHGIRALPGEGTAIHPSARSGGQLGVLARGRRRKRVAREARPRSAPVRPSGHGPTTPGASVVPPGSPLRRPIMWRAIRDHGSPRSRCCVPCSRPSPLRTASRSSALGASPKKRSSHAAIAQGW
jgi:hypothetical protein